ncbi:caspase family protein [Nonomuraea sp. NPDC048882]|uniref:caspase, EACC1-associated type n=1 Tax=Nonomuraea sp. NPDC048882 TaxID=3154347 RepID=UPI0033EB2BB5
MSGGRKALIIANDVYENPSLGRLRSPVQDARALARALGDPGIGGFEVRVVHNEPAYQMAGQIEDFFLDAVPGDLLVLHLSCHGVKSESGELFFAARNTRPNRLGSTAVPADFVQRCMRGSRSKSIVLFLDCCYGGAFTEGAVVRASGDVNVLDSFAGQSSGAGGRGQAVITASTSMEYAFEGDQLSEESGPQPSIFTNALVEGLVTGDADGDEDGQVSLDELYDYVFDRVRDQNPNQTPSRSFDLQGELYLARSGRRRIQPLPVPPDLRAAMTDPSIFARRGAITELRHRLTSDNLPAAAGARDALQEMAHNDIDYIATAAQEALREALVQPAEHRVDFGQVPQHSTPSHTVPVLGPPLARACSFQVSNRGIHVEQDATGLHISLDTSHQGSVQGDILLKDPIQETAIHVEAIVTAPQPADVTTGPRNERASPPNAERPSREKAAPRQPPLARTQGPPPERVMRSRGSPPTHGKAFWALGLAIASLLPLPWAAWRFVDFVAVDASSYINTVKAADGSPEIIRSVIMQALWDILTILILTAVGIVLFIKARRLAGQSNQAISASPGRYGGRGVNQAALILSWAAIACTLLVLLVRISSSM